MPVMEKFYKPLTDVEHTFHSEVYFINKTVQMAVKWGTPDKVHFIDPLTKTPLELGASGEMNLAVDNGRKLLIKLVGTMKGISWEEGLGFTKSLQASFRPLIVNAVKTNLPVVIKQNEIDILEIDEKLDLVSASLVEKIRPGFEEYGLTIPQFYVNNVVLPENDPNFKQILELHTVVLQTKKHQAEATVLASKAASEAQYRTAQEQSKAVIEAARREAELQRQQTETEIARREAERKLIAAQADAQTLRMKGMTEAEIMQLKGYNQKDVFQADVQKTLAESIGRIGGGSVGGGGGGFVGDLVSLGVGIHTAQTLIPQVGNMFQGMNSNGGVAVNNGANSGEGMRDGGGMQKSGWDCPSCGAKGITFKFCPDCGAKKPEPKPADAWDCPSCGKKGITTKFCPECGAKRPEKPKGWTCPSCGKRDIMTKFCPECGTKKPEEKPAAEEWTCPDCGAEHITGKFCPECGTKRGE